LARTAGAAYVINEGHSSVTRAARSLERPLKRDARSAGRASRDIHGGMMTDSNDAAEPKRGARSAATAVSGPIVAVDIVRLQRCLFEAIEQSTVSQNLEGPIHGGVAEPWWSVEEGAAYAHVSVDTFKNWLKQKLLPCGSVGRLRRVRRADIDTLLLSHLDCAPDNDASPSNSRADEILRSIGRRHG
jgi:excisionase family DNA binding protein